jgi:vancomycin permeability regulator SanA
MLSLSKKVILIILALAIIGACAALLINIHIRSYSSQYILSAEDAALIKDIDAILVLGCLVRNDSPSDMLRDRLEIGIELYNTNASPKLLMSGDHGQKDYDEVGVMKKYATENGVPSEDVFMDHAGFSTYESMYRAKEVFGVDKVVVVTQNYHLYRAIYIARRLGIEAYGVASDLNTYTGQINREMREVAAICKDFLYCIFKPEPTCLGEKVDMAGDGNVTNS